MVPAFKVAFLCFALAGDFEFSDFTSTKDLFLVRSAHRSKRVLRLTDAIDFIAGAAWFRTKQPVWEGFDITFTFRYPDPDNGRARGADGLAFVIQSERRNALGGLGASGGFMRSDVGAPGPGEYPILRRLAVFFDTFQKYMG
jgi:hypothetical protein